LVDFRRKKDGFYVEKMSSMLRAIKTTPAIVGYFRGDNPASDITVKFIVYPLKFTIGTYGVVAIQGNNIFFDTYANARALLQSPGSYGNNSNTIISGEIYRDMGQTVNIFTGQYRTDNIQHVATLTKVQKIENTGQATEGVTGKTLNLASGSPPIGNNYTTGYIVTWSSNPDAGAGVGIPVGATRTGHQ
jgi:hypothetical protein